MIAAFHLFFQPLFALKIRVYRPISKQHAAVRKLSEGFVMQDDRLISIEELIKIVPVSKATVYRRLADGTLPSVTFGRRRLYPLAKVKAALGLVEIVK